VFGAIAVGTLAAVAIPSAAEAHTVAVNGTSRCENGHPVVDWVVTLGRVPAGETGEVTSITFTPAGSTFAGDLALHATHTGNGVITGTQIVTAAGATTAKISNLRIDWTDQVWATYQSSGDVVLDTNCASTQTPERHASAALQCDGSVIVTLSSSINGGFVVAAADGAFRVIKNVTAGEPGTVTVPANQATGISVITVDGSTPIPLAAPEPATGCEVPVVNAVPSCDGLSIEVSNPGTKSVAVTLKPSSGDEKDFDLAPGAKRTEVFTGTEGLTVTAEATGLKQTITWAKDASCATPTPPAAAPELPTTGSSLTLPITIGAVLVAAGVVLLFVYRRRRSVQ
jgi:LPXTG-motif cell wall-anchored protein